ncbi:MAG: hydroxymyristoyl-ACP dehydratase [Rikenellaceae bacterium]
MNNKVFKVKFLSSSEQVFKYSAEVITSHIIFNGHFPQHPVVPGVCTINMIKDCIEDIVSRQVRYDYIKECKFLSAIEPSSHSILNVNMTIEEESDFINVMAMVMDGETKIMKLKATLI